MSLVVALIIGFSYVPLVLLMILADHLANRAQDDACIHRRLDAITDRGRQRHHFSHE